MADDLTYGSICAGVDGLSMGVQSVLGGTTSWVAEYDPEPSRVLAHNSPGVPNLGDITKVDWTKVEPVDVLDAGYPCQPFSHAGHRKGTADSRHLWPVVAEAVAALRPSLCVFENVRGHLTLGFDEVVRDLHQLDYSVIWYTLRAADIGAAHGRARLFIFAEDKRNESSVRSRLDRRGGVHRHPEERRNLPRSAQSGNGRQGAPGTPGAAIAVRRNDLPRASEGGAQQSEAGLDTDWREGDGRHRSTASLAADKGPLRRHRAGVPVDAQRAGAQRQQRTELDTRGEGQGRDVESQTQGRKQGRARADAADAAEGSTAGYLPLGMVVGAGGDADGSGRVRGTVPDIGDHGRWARLPDSFATDLTLLPTPAVNDMGAAYTPETWDVWTDRMKAAHGNGNGHGKSLSIEALRLLPTPRTSDTNGAGSHGQGGPDLRTVVGALLPTPTTTQRGPDANLDTREGARANLDTREGALLPTPSAADGMGGHTNRSGDRSHELLLPGVTREMGHAQGWGVYEAAIRRHEAAFGHPAPPPTESGAKGQPRLSPAFVEWMMMLPPGHVTNPVIWEGVKPTTARNAQLRILGNGVVPPQAAEATLRWLHDRALT